VIWTRWRWTRVFNRFRCPVRWRRRVGRLTPSSSATAFSIRTRSFGVAGWFNTESFRRIRLFALDPMKSNLRRRRAAFFSCRCVLASFRSLSFSATVLKDWRSSKSGWRISRSCDASFIERSISKCTRFPENVARGFVIAHLCRYSGSYEVIGGLGMYSNKCEQTIAACRIMHIMKILMLAIKAKSPCRHRPAPRRRAASLTIPGNRSGNSYGSARPFWVSPLQSMLW